MLTEDLVPREPERLARLFVQLPRLAADGPGSCPVAVDVLAGLVAEELGLGADPGDGLDADRLAFARTAELDGVRYWVWHLADGVDGVDEADEADDDGGAEGAEGSGRLDVWVVVADDPDDEPTLGCIVDRWGLTAEQAVAGDHFGVV